MLWGMPILRAKLMFLPNVPVATFIPGATSIPESRVSRVVHNFKKLKVYDTNQLHILFI